MEIINQFQVYTYTYMNTWITADRMGRPIEIGKSNIVQRSCVSDAIRLWNLAPPEYHWKLQPVPGKKRNKKVCQNTSSLRSKIEQINQQ